MLTALAPDATADRVDPYPFVPGKNDLGGTTLPATQPRVSMAARSLAALILAAAVVLAPPTQRSQAAPAAAASPASADTAMQLVEIDGRFVMIELSVVRTIGGAPIDPLIPVTTAHVRVSIMDGAPLPAGLTAVGVRFEKLRGVNRFFFTRTTEVDPGELAFEEDAKAYTADLADRRTVQNLRAVVRLELDGQVIKVPMGVVRVTTVPLP